MVTMFMLPMVCTLLALALIVPMWVHAMWVRAEAPMQGEYMPGWALALDYELEAAEWVDAIDTLWDEEEESVPHTLRSSGVRAVAYRVEPTVVESNVVYLAMVRDAMMHAIVGEGRRVG